MKTLLHNPPAACLKVPVLVSVALLLGSTAALSSQILLPNQSAAPGASIRSQVDFAAQSSSVSGVQFDVHYDNSVLSLAATLGDSPKNSGKSLYAVDLAPDKKRFLIIGLNQTLIPNGALINLSVNVRQSAPSGVYALTLSNVGGTDPSGQAAAITGSDGAVTVNAGSSLGTVTVVNAASLLPGPLAPGELVTLFGSGIGPIAAQRPAGSASSLTLGGTAVLFDGTPAALLYAAPGQINAIVPFGVPGKTTTQLAVTAQGHTVAGSSLEVAATAPAIFTLNSTGVGAGAILNQDLTVNSPSNPADKGSVIAIFATGAGQTTPPSLDAQITGTSLPSLVERTSVQISSLDAEVLYAGAAPGLIAGVVQVNVRLPSNTPSLSAVPVVLSVGGASSQASVTIAIR